MKKLITLLITVVLTTYLQAGIHTVTNTNDNGAGSLRHFINVANANDTIRFNPNLTALGNDTLFLDSTLSTNKSLTIIGNRTTLGEICISGQNLYRVFHVNCLGNFYLDSVNIIDGNESLMALGGGLFFTGDTLKINYCQFKNNYARIGGAISATKLIVTNTNFLSNESRIRGAAINSTLYCSIKDCQLIGNKGIFLARDGIAIYANGNLEIIGTFVQFTTSTSSIKNSTVAFGGTSADKLYIAYSLISDNVGTGLMTTGDPKIEILNSRFNKNEKGGADINTNERVTIKNTHFNENQAGGGLRIIGSYHTVTLDSLVIKNNIAVSLSGGGIYSIGNDTLSLLNSIIDSNKSSFSGGGSVLDARCLKIDNSTIQGNESDTDLSGSIGIKGGSGLNITSTHVDIANSTFSGNYSDTSDSRICAGGAILMSNRGSTDSVELNLNINACTFDNNISNYSSAISMGIGYFASLNKATCNLLINNSTFTENASSEKFSIDVWGGSTIENQINTSIKNSTIYKNYGKGESIYLGYSSSATGINNSQIKIKSSIIAFNNLSNFHTDSLISEGYNLLTDSSLSNSHTTDQLGVTISSLNLGSLQQNGGVSQTLLPLAGSLAIGGGTPTDFSDAQNGSVTDSRRDVGACEAGVGVGVKENLVSLNQVVLFPNPTTDNVYLKFERDIQNASVSVYDIAGNLVLESIIIRGNNTAIQTQDLKTGMYLIKIETPEYRISKRLIKQ